MLVAVAVAVGGPVASVGAQGGQAPISDLVLPVVDIELAVSSLDESIRVTRQRVTLQTDVLFAFNTARLNPRGRSRIRQAVAEIRSRRARQVTIEGHTDSKGGDAFNVGLSLRRAQAVQRALRAGLGARAPQLRATGRGEKDPIAANTAPDGGDNPRGRARNRRVELRLG